MYKEDQKEIPSNMHNFGVDEKVDEIEKTKIDKIEEEKVGSTKRYV